MRNNAIDVICPPAETTLATSLTGTFCKSYMVQSPQQRQTGSSGRTAHSIPGKAAARRDSHGPKKNTAKITGVLGNGQL